MKPTLTLLLVLLLPRAAGAQPLPGTQPLAPNPDFSAAMVAGIDKMALRGCNGDFDEFLNDKLNWK